MSTQSLCWVVACPLVPRWGQRSEAGSATLSDPSGHWAVELRTKETFNIYIYIYYISGHWGKGRGKKGQDERESSLVVGELLCCEVRHGAGGESESSQGWKWKSSLVVGKWFCCGNVGRGSERESSLVVGKWLCCGDMGFGVGGGSENHP